ncbi:hypothetical protein BRD17_05235 [Halobacteriales archaeon SW_7_68_16]|nr:MAG: hypothetical protein BRD17_05235 [Halobacteriales archaeon SW_7_68_16]
METLHPRVRTAWVVRGLVVAAVLGLAVGALVALLLVDRAVGFAAASATAVGLIAVVTWHTTARYRAWGFAVGDDSLRIERGVVTQVTTAVPFVRVQHVDTRRGPIERLLGLASVVVYTAGSRQADVTIPGLSPDRARDLQERLRELTTASEREDGV